LQPKTLLSLEKKNLFAVTPEELAALFDFRNSFRITNKFVLYLVGILLTPVTLSGALLGFIWGYMRIMFKDRDLPLLQPLKPIMRVAMIIGSVLIWIILLIVIRLFVWLWVDVFGWQPIIFAYYVVINLILTLLVFLFFTKWQMRLIKFAQESRKFGSARYAKKDDLKEYENRQGFYIGGGYTFAEKGHILTTGGTRSGKGTNLVIPNLLGLGGYAGSWVVIDPKGENAAITARYQRESGKEVVILNPWGLLQDNVGKAQSYNPLDILNDKTSPHLVDDVQIIAEMIVPIDPNDGDKFFTDSARSIVAGLLLHIVTALEPKKERLPRCGIIQGCLGMNGMGLLPICGRTTPL
jgi:type IV secretion system protein VirD4